MNLSNSYVASTNNGCNLPARMHEHVSLRRLGAVKQSPIPFPWKLHEMLEDATSLNFDATVSWIPEDTGFRVHNVQDFVDNIMPRYFNQSKYKSFQRQLNMWGFERILSGPFKGGYVHDKFVKGEPGQCSHMRRQKVKGGDSSSPSKAQKTPPPHSSRKRKVGRAPDAAGSSAAIAVRRVKSVGRVSITSVSDLAPAGAVRDKTRDMPVTSSDVKSKRFNGPHLIIPNDIECLEFAGRTFFGILDGDDFTTKKNALVNNISSSSREAKLSFRRCSLDFMVPV